MTLRLPALVPAVALGAAALLPARASRAECSRLTRPLAQAVAASVRPRAPAWARPLLTAQQLMQFDSAGLHALTYFPGYGAITLERLGTGGARPFSASVVVRCRDGRVEYVPDAFAWANARAHALHVTIANAEQAAGFAAEVVSLEAGRRPDAANATRTGPVFRVEVSMAPHPGDAEASAHPVALEVGRDASIRRLP